MRGPMVPREKVYRVRAVNVCEECKNPIATQADEAAHNTGECGCEESRSLCWKAWGGCESPYDTLRPKPKPSVELCGVPFDEGGPTCTLPKGHDFHSCEMIQAGQCSRSHIDDDLREEWEEQYLYKIGQLEWELREEKARVLRIIEDAPIAIGAKILLKRAIEGASNDG